MTPEPYSACGDSESAAAHIKEAQVTSGYEGLPAAANVQQAICLAQLQILRRMERERKAAAA